MRELDALVEPVAPGAHRAAGRPPAGLAAAGYVVALVAALPAVYLVVRAAGGGLPRVVEVLASPATAALLARTMLLTAAVTVSAVAIALPLAWLTVRTDLPGRRVWVVLTALPLVVPSYVGAYAFVAALGPRGIVRDWLAPLGVQRLPELYGLPGAWAVLTLFTYPYALITVRAALRGLDPALEEASRSLGCGGRETFVRVTLPQLRPAIAAGGLLVALYTLHDFGAVSLLRFDVFTRAIYVQYRSSFDRTAAATLAAVLVAITLLVVGAELRTRGHRVYYRTSGVARSHAEVRLGGWRWPAFAACAAIVGLAVVLPLAVIASWLARGVAAGGAVKLAAPALHSLEAAAAGSLVTLLAAWPVAVLAARHPGRTSRTVERASYVGFALPGIVVALSLVFFGARYAPVLYQSLPMLTLAYVVLFLPQASGALRTSLAQVNPHLEEASRSLGAGRVLTLRRVVLPLVRPGIQGGLVLVFLTAMKELPATLLLAPIGFSTLATQVWNATTAARFAEAAAPALALVALASAPLAFLVLRKPKV